MRLAEEGADIIAVDRCDDMGCVPYPLATPDDLAETVRQVEALGRRIVARVADVRDQAALTSAVDDGVAELRPDRHRVANAGVNRPTPAKDMDEEVWLNVVDVDLSGVWRTCKAAIPHLIAGGRGGPSC